MRAKRELRSFVIDWKLAELRLAYLARAPGATRDISAPPQRRRRNAPTVTEKSLQECSSALCCFFSCPTFQG